MYWGQSVSPDYIQSLLNSIENYKASTVVSLAGVLLCIFALRNPKDGGASKRRDTWLISIGATLVVIAQLVSFINLRFERRTTPEQAFQHLKDNARVEWLIRLVPYDPNTQPGLAVGSGYTTLPAPSANSSAPQPLLRKLGPENERYVFVADYFELRDYTVEEAINKVGGSFKNGNHVSAMIFPLRNGDLIPANARGLLQIIEGLDTENAQNRNYCRFEFSELSDEAKRNLGQGDLNKKGDDPAFKINTWEWENYSQYYDDFRRAVKQFRTGSPKCPKGRYSAESLIGDIRSDWNDVGYSQFKEGSDLKSPTFFLSKGDGGLVSLENFGVRAFLMENMEITSIPGRVMIDFDKPAEDRIPDLTGKVGTSVGLVD